MTMTAPMAPVGAVRIKDCWEVYPMRTVRGLNTNRILEYISSPNVSNKMEVKFDIPPLGMELNNVARHTSQIRMSLKLSSTWLPLTCAFCVPLKKFQPAFMNASMVRHHGEPRPEADICGEYAYL